MKNLGEYFDGKSRIMMNKQPSQTTESRIGEYILLYNMCITYCRHK